jgi:hypothetical protein
MLEGTDAKVHFIYYTPEMEEARSRGELGSNSFIRLRKRSATATFDVNHLGDAEKICTISVRPRTSFSTTGSYRRKMGGAGGWDDIRLRSEMQAPK